MSVTLSATFVVCNLSLCALGLRLSHLSVKSFQPLTINIFHLFFLSFMAIFFCTLLNICEVCRISDRILEMWVVSLFISRSPLSVTFPQILVGVFLRYLF